MSASAFALTLILAGATENAVQASIVAAGYRTP
jgi:hypothetical protein